MVRLTKSLLFVFLFFSAFCVSAHANYSVFFHDSMVEVHAQNMSDGQKTITQMVILKSGQPLNFMLNGPIALLGIPEMPRTETGEAQTVTKLAIQTRKMLVALAGHRILYSDLTTERFFIAEIPTLQSTFSTGAYSVRVADNKIILSAAEILPGASTPSFMNYLFTTEGVFTIRSPLNLAKEVPLSKLNAAELVDDRLGSSRRLSIVGLNEAGEHLELRSEPKPHEVGLASAAFPNLLGTVEQELENQRNRGLLPLAGSNLPAVVPKPVAPAGAQQPTTAPPASTQPASAQADANKSAEEKPRSTSKMDFAEMLNDPRLKGLKIKDLESREVSLVGFIENNFRVIKPSGKAKPEEYEAEQKNLRKAVSALLTRKGGSVAITGRPGTGKTYFAELLFDYLADTQGKHEMIRDRVYLAMTVDEIMSGTTYRGQLEVKMRALQVLAEHIPVTIFVDEMHTLMGAGTTAGDRATKDLFQSMLSLMEQGRVKIVGTTTDREWAKYFSSNQAIVDRFGERLYITERSEADTAAILKKMISREYAADGISISDEMIKAVVEIASRFDPIGANPRKSIKLMSSIVAKSIYDEKRQVTRARVTQLASEFYGYDLSKFTPTGIKRMMGRLRQRLSKDLIGLNDQKETIDLIMGDHFFNLLTKNSFKPTSLLLRGPRGVGKTSIGKSVAAGLDFGFDRVMMSQYKNEYDVEKFRSRLATVIVSTPFKVILLDEVEKAHPAVQDALLDVLDSGRFEANIAGAGGATNITEVDASKSVFIGTTNAGKGISSDAEFISRAGNDGLSEYLADRFGAHILVSSPSEKTQNEILRTKWRSTVDELNSSGRTVTAGNESALLDFLFDKVREQQSGSRSIGFGRAAEPGETSVRPLEAELAKVRQRIAGFFIKNPRAKSARVEIVDGQIVVSDPSTAVVAKASAKAPTSSLHKMAMCRMLFAI